MKQGFFALYNHPSTAFVKEASFFIDQGGLEEEWGESWEYFEAYDLEDAQRIASNIYKERKRDLR